MVNTRTSGLVSYLPIGEEDPGLPLRYTRSAPLYDRDGGIEKKREMYQENPQFEKPADRNSRIWRYMTLEKYKAMIESRSLYFCTVEKLREKEPYEGSCLGWELLSNVSLEAAQELVRKVRSCGPPITVNCWHLSEFESMAMWRLYGNEVAVQSTFDRLVRSLGDCPCDVRIGCVKYFMPGNDIFSSPGPFTAFVPLLHKHRGFAYEQELRAVIWETGNMRRERDGSVLAPVDLSVLIEAVHVSPRARSGLREEVQGLTNAHGLDAQVLQSELAKIPLY